MYSHPDILQYMIQERINTLHAEAKLARQLKHADSRQPGLWARLCFELGKRLASAGRNLQRRYHPQLNPGTCLPAGK